MFGVIGAVRFVVWKLAGLRSLVALCFGVCSCG